VQTTNIKISTGNLDYIVHRGDAVLSLLYAAVWVQR